MFLALALPKFKGIFILSIRNFRWAFSVLVRRSKLEWLGKLGIVLLESLFKESCWTDNKNTVVNPEKRTLQIKWKAETGHVYSGFYSRFKIITIRLNPLALHSPRGQSWSNRFFPPQMVFLLYFIKSEFYLPLCALLIISFLFLFAQLSTHPLFISICVYCLLLKANMLILMLIKNGFSLRCATKLICAAY